MTFEARPIIGEGEQKGVRIRGSVVNSDNPGKRNLARFTDRGSWQRLKPAAREMRKQPTRAEDILWQRLRRHQLRGMKFRRQHLVGRYIVDFYCAEAKLVIEVDGPVHDYGKGDDKNRQDFIESTGLKVIRFSNDEVLEDIDTIVEKIAGCLP
jgi:very-short-patch-repair endonuclease